MEQRATSRLSILMISSLALMTSACSNSPVTPVTPAVGGADTEVTIEPEVPAVIGESDVVNCEKLNVLIADHKNNFKTVRGSRLNSRTTGIMQIWMADNAFPFAKKCQVWAWSAGLTSYVCGWSEANEQQAKSSYDNGVSKLSQCLGEQWQAQTQNSSGGGAGQIFEQAGNKTVVSIRYFKESRSILENWKALLYVGDKSNMEAAAR
ncbi:MAG: hypothetical protein GQ582_12945 [Methyloprofundus sp.]|nr:hypothetical protein [Methyloprofundus sp.]